MIDTNSLSVGHKVEEGQVYRKEESPFGKIFEMEIDSIHLTPGLDDPVRISIYERTPTGSSSRIIGIEKFNEFIDAGFEFTWERE